LVARVRRADHHPATQTTREQRQLITLKDAGEYIAKLPKAEHSATVWQTAIEALLLAVCGGPTMPARIGIMKTLNRKPTG
jgi:hypothetical protein